MSDLKWKEEFAQIWNSSDSLAEFLDNYPRPIKKRSASAMAATLRAQGYGLRFFGKPGPQDAASRLERIKKLRKGGATMQEIADTIGVSRQRVQQILAQRNGREMKKGQKPKKQARPLPPSELKPCYLGWRGCTGLGTIKAGDGWLCANCAAGDHD